MGPARKRLADVLACLTGEMGPSFKHFFAWPDAVHFQEGTITWTWTGRKPKAQYKNVTRTFPMVYDSVSQLWEDLTARGVLAEDWSDCRRRSFYSPKGSSPSPYPLTIKKLASLAAYGGESLVLAEELVREFNRRLFILGEEPLVDVTWCGVCYNSTYRENPWGFLRYVGTSLDIFSEWSKIYHNTPAKGPTNLVTLESPKQSYKEVMCGVQFWPKYLELTKRDKETPNPFEPLRDLYHLGFGLGTLAGGKCMVLYTLLGP